MASFKEKPKEDFSVFNIFLVLSHITLITPTHSHRKREIKRMQYILPTVLADRTTCGHTNEMFKYAELTFSGQT